MRSVRVVSLVGIIFLSLFSTITYMKLESFWMNTMGSLRSLEKGPYRLKSSYIPDDLLQTKLCQNREVKAERSRRPSGIVPKFYAEEDNTITTQEWILCATEQNSRLRQNAIQYRGLGDGLPWPEEVRPRGRIISQFCDEDENWTRYNDVRRKLWSNPTFRRQNKLWQTVVDNKLGAFLFSRTVAKRKAEEAAARHGWTYHTPDIYFCGDGVHSLEDFNPPPELSSRGFVVKSVNGHGGTKGTAVLPSGFEGSGKNTKKEIMDKFSRLGFSEGPIYVEEFISSWDTPGLSAWDYKFYMYGSKISHVFYTAFRSTARMCQSWLNEDFEQEDFGGCHVENPNGVFTAGGGRTFTCSHTEWVHERGGVPEYYEAMKDIARELSIMHGLHIRVDLLVSDEREILLGEFTHNSWMPGMGLCGSGAGPYDVDPCKGGRMWKEYVENTGGNMQLGGTVPPVPQEIRDWVNYDAEEGIITDVGKMCSDVINVAMKTNKHTYMGL